MRSTRPTRAQKIIIKKWHLNPENWRVVKELPEKMIIEHKHTNTVKEIPESTMKRREERQEAI